MGLKERIFCGLAAFRASGCWGTSRSFRGLGLWLLGEEDGIIETRRSKLNQKEREGMNSCSPVPPRYSSNGGSELYLPTVFKWKTVGAHIVGVIVYSRGPDSAIGGPVWRVMNVHPTGNQRSSTSTSRQTPVVRHEPRATVWSSTHMQKRGDSYHHDCAASKSFLQVADLRKRPNLEIDLITIYGSSSPERIVKEMWLKRCM